MDVARPAPGANEPGKAGSATGRHGRRFRIEGIQFLDEIGRGHGTLVYRALRLADHLEVAIKVLPPVDDQPSPRLEAFLHAGRRVKGLHHPNLLSCFDADVAFGCGYQILEVASGPALSHFASDQGGSPMPYKEALGLAIDAARGVEALAREDLIHGRIAPTNVFLGPDRQAMLAVPSGPLPRREDGTKRLALYRAQAGCMPPEVLLERSDCTQRGDLYSLGSLLRQLITGEPTRPAASWEELEAVLTGITNVGAELVHGVPAGLNAVLRRCLALDQAQRYASATQLREDLERVQNDFSPIHARINPTVSFGRRRNSATDSEGQRVHSDPSGPVALEPLPKPLPQAPPPPPRTELPSPSEAPAPESAGRNPGGWIIVAAAVLVALAAAGAVLWLLFGAQAPRPMPTSTSTNTTATSGSGMGSATASAIGSTSDRSGAASGAPVPATPLLRWAAATGTDDYGRWANLLIHGCTQRFRFCPAGTFTMGSDASEANRRSDEDRTEVTLSHGFWIADSAVTQDLYESVMGEDPSTFHGAKLPIDSLTFDHCQDFIRILSSQVGTQLRLPSEAEWEYACRAGSTGAYAVPPAESSWSREISSNMSHPVKVLQPNAWGLYDLEGDMLQWCSDTYGPYAGKPVKDPIATGGIFQVARGGAWSMPATEARSAARHHYESVAHLFFIGARLVIDDLPERAPAAHAQP